MLKYIRENALISELIYVKLFSYSELIARLESRKDVIFLLIFATLVYLSIYYVYPARPGFNPYMGIGYMTGWLGWNDQRAYYGESSAIIDGTFGPESFIYAIGYPVLSVPFIPFMSEHRFLIPDLAMYLAIIFMTYQLTLKFLGKQRYAFMSVLLLMFLTNYTYYFIEPWINHVMDFAIVAMFYLLFRDVNNFGLRSGIMVGIILGWALATRYVEFVFLLPMALVLVIYRPKKVFSFFPFAIIIGLVLLLQYSTFGDPLERPHEFSLKTIQPGARAEYEAAGGELFTSNPSIILQRIYCMTINPMACVTASGDPYADDWWFRALVDKTPIIASTSGFFVLAPIGFARLIRKYHGYQRYLLLSLLVSFIAETVFYLGFYGFTSGWARFFRYHELWFPILTVLSVVGLQFIITKLFHTKFTTTVPESR